MINNYTAHQPVLFDEVISSIKDNLSDDYKMAFDFTFGGGGHSFGLLENFPTLNLISFDQDPEALENGWRNIAAKNLGERIKLLSGNFSQFDNVLRENQITSNPDVILMDLGVSSHHFDSPGRGFSFRFDAPLDMRMDFLKGQTAADIINSFSAEELKRIFIDFGEIYNSEALIERIMIKRQASPILTTFDLKELVYQTWAPKKGVKIDPCTQVFQALRMEVNQELKVIEEVIKKAARVIRPNGIIMAITFHSIEDRTVKNLFKELEEGETPFQIVTKKPIIPSEQEISNNKRSRSAKLRVIKRVSEKKKKNKYHQFSRKE
ncbi:MAG: 16S rRNA (cytosine(1402)-N(4))-methyltransferase [Bdellovibrio sp. CG12_big_fil_rev_8_21_14_0_65_39_13]|nr:MAG: 16S rRNA (cytosine(1402)-N(4))-methyltransferase [Bdellovibrio sp. CG22_combo_CG10-13_8_21_14_all_39_27]PIQ60795.1 MAG: 16S rRNA (cytosine(1402)-N(4))-methyltransferase [Bdellovibrio sp. CG12_big_fil_rev_8_21_14_0_65_39_13]PIR36418.1 MAG: 16S rRNA (cytosine(1402)-N(4))-methyltransferase [Bdellovibrio sp. CG11_big_fil_rev_8_21_14_0_20_39_38]PJB53072.1 MAG: 16S rRNA (cytosine(1402)-N(4))-methyltransferase [Bdellovibrio sp. CG_4_9_14_3_um_filter_39_7]